MCRVLTLGNSPQNRATKILTPPQHRFTRDKTHGALSQSCPEPWRKPLLTQYHPRPLHGRYTAEISHTPTPTYPSIIQQHRPSQQSNHAHSTSPLPSTPPEPEGTGCRQCTGSSGSHSRQRLVAREANRLHDDMLPPHVASGRLVAQKRLARGRVPEHLYRPRDKPWTRCWRSRRALIA